MSVDVTECDVCGEISHTTEICPELITDGTTSYITLARQTLPAGFQVLDEESGVTNVVTLNDLPAKSKYGPVMARSVKEEVKDTNFSLQIVSKDDGNVYLDTRDENECNWLTLIPPALDISEQNCIAFQLGHGIYYSTIRDVMSGEMLKVWYAPGYARKIQKADKPPGYDINVTADPPAQIVGENTEEQDLNMLCPDLSFTTQKHLDEHIAEQNDSSIDCDANISQSHTEGASGIDALPLQKNTTGMDKPEKTTLIGLSCRQCSYIAESVSALAIHITSTHLSEARLSDGDSVPISTVKKRVWTCADCGVVFSNPRSLGSHKKLHHAPRQVLSLRKDMTDDTEQAPDDGAGMQVINIVIEREDTDMPNVTDLGQSALPAERLGRGKRKRRLPRHLEATSVLELDSTFECLYCAETCNSDETLQAHIRSTHTFPCKQCNVEFSTHDGREKHFCKAKRLAIDIGQYQYLADDSNTIHYSCPFCSDVYDDQGLFNEHLIWHCMALPCEVCKRHCTSVEALEGHVKSCNGSADLEADTDSVTEMFRCDDCGLLLCDPDAAKAHVNIHTSFKCEKCDSQYFSKYGLQQHLLSCNPSQLDTVSPVFACLECLSVFPYQQALQFHNSEHHSDGRFQCIDCQMLFSEQEAFENHPCTTVPKPAATTCDICGKGFKTNKALVVHYMKHTRSFDCKICKQIFENKDELIKHSLECSARDMLKMYGKINCAHCEQSFTDVSLYWSHLDTHTKKRECRKCKKKFKSSKILHKHESRCRPKSRAAHSRCRTPAGVVSQTNYKCPICEKSFVRKDYYVNHECRNLEGKVIEREGQPLLHEEVSETDNNNCMCFQCGKLFSSHSNLNKHLKLHEDKQVYCHACGKAFHQIHAMQLHYDSVHTSKLKVPCPHCNKMFRNKYGLNTHIKQFHASHITIYACDVCGKKFRQKGNMVKHMIAHDISRHYPCSFCSKSFKYPEQLKRHSLLHTQGKTLECDMCDRKFVMQYELNKHLREFHNNKIFVCTFCNETCRWRHTMRRHIKRKHPRFTALADDPAYLSSLLKDTNELEEPAVTVLTSDMEPHQASYAAVLSVGNQLVELDGNEHLVANSEESGIQMLQYTQEALLPQAAIEALSRVTANGQSQQITINNQQFTIHVADGHTLISLNKDESNSGMTSLLRAPTASDITQQPNTHVVMNDDALDTLPAGAQVVMANDGTATMVYSAEPLSNVGFTDISQLGQVGSDDANKMMFFNLLGPSQDSQS